MNYLKSTRKSKKKKFFFATGSIVIIVLAIGWFAHAQTERENQTADKVKELESSQYIPKIKTQKVALTESKELLKFSAIMDAADRVEIVPEVSAKALSILVGNGDVVQKGQVIAYLEKDSGLIANLRAAETALEVAKEVEVDTERLYKQLKRDADGTSSETASKRQYDLYVDTANGSVKSSKNSIAYLQANLAKYTITAPASGVINNLSSTVGDTISAGKVFASIVNDKNIEIKTGFSGTEISKISVGQEVEVENCLEGNVSCKGEVISVGTVMDSASKKFPVEIEIENINQQIKTGIVVHAGIVISKKEGVIIIPSTAIFEKDDETFIYLVGNEQKVSLQKVKFEKVTNETLMVTEGLAVDDEFIVNGKYELAEGAEVEIIENL